MICIVVWVLNMENQREHFASRIGFILMTAGCAIGLGNVWRFPFITGKYGGGLFVLLYLVCLVLFGLPVLLMELSLGRAAQSTYPGAFRKLANKESRFKWHIPAYVLFSGNLILLMFYTVITGWLLNYTTAFVSMSNAVWEEGFFFGMMASPGRQTVYMLISLLMTLFICLGGVQKTIEKSVKVMMGGLLLLLLVLIGKAFTLDGAMKGVSFFLTPKTHSEYGYFEILHAAMSQAFFTLSLGIGSVAICGSYINKEHSLFKEGLWIVLLDTFVAVASGLIIFPSCISFGVEPGAGPSLIFQTLPRVFHSMPLGFLWGGLFFVFLVVAALSTLIAVFENLVAFGMDEWAWSRKKSCWIFGIILALLSLPCIFGFNIWSSFQPLGEKSTILDLEDFIVSANLLPLGAAYMTFFCISKSGCGKENFFAEVNCGKGMKLPYRMYNYIKFVIVPVILLLWVIGIWNVF